MVHLDSRGGERLREARRCCSSRKAWITHAPRGVLRRLPEIVGRRPWYIVAEVEHACRARAGLAEEWVKRGRGGFGCFELYRFVALVVRGGASGVRAQWADAIVTGRANDEGGRVRRGPIGPVGLIAQAILIEVRAAAAPDAAGVEAAGVVAVAVGKVAGRAAGILAQLEMADLEIE